MIPKNASGFIKEGDELKPEQPWLRIQLQHLTSRTRPSGSFILFEDIKHVLTLTSEQSYFAAVDYSRLIILPPAPPTLSPSKSAEPKYTMMTPNPNVALGILTLTHHAQGCKEIANSTFPNHWEARRTAVHGNSSVPTLAYRAKAVKLSGIDWEIFSE